VVKLHANVAFLFLKLQRKRLTRHGQHLNNSGKELVSFELAKSVEQFVNKMKTASIQIQWKQDNLGLHSKIVKFMESFDIDDTSILSEGEIGKSNNEEVPSHDMHQQVPSEELGRIPEDTIQVGRTSSRQNKATITGSKDFLWQK
jgi:hypothetical protein